MKIIKCLTKLIEEELTDAKKYAELALSYAADPPAEMLAVYNYLHERHITEAKEVKIMQGMYDGR